MRLARRELNRSNSPGGFSMQQSKSRCQPNALAITAPCHECQNLLTILYARAILDDNLELNTLLSVAGTYFFHTPITGKSRIRRPVAAFGASRIAGQFPPRRPLHEEKEIAARQLTCQTPRRKTGAFGW